MATRVRFRRGTTAQTSTFTGVEGELTIDTDKKTAVVHDGSTAGGHDLLRADARRGYIRREHFLNNGTYTKNNKPDLKRIEVEIFGGGGGGATGAGGGGGASGGSGYVVLEATDITENVTVTIGQGGAAANAGTASTFGEYITANGGNAGNNDGTGGASGTTTGTNVTDMGGFPGGNGNGSSIGGNGGGPGGGGQAAAYGKRGGGGARNTAGAQGSVIIYEIYGEV